jgi:murein DD-endopeptidase MepM/ murein hydrolase activator NlpD
VEFENPSNTPIIAAEAGKVVVAGDDHTTSYGPATDFYGNLVVVQLDQTFQNQPVFTLYGHMKTILVRVGQHVNTGQQIGVVGATGVAIGPHLHFEVRVGENDYFSSRNPELWLKPLRYNGLYQGAVAGRVVDIKGRLVQGYPVVLRPIVVDSDAPRSRYVTTYTADAFGLAGDAILQENFGTTDLPLGSYTISVNTTKTYQQVINVTSGSLTWVTFVVEPPPLVPLASPTP